ncbi:MAG: hypothetical protein H3C47_08435 [Candidatus Cloacimonetes bacterium]|nr:hypothetical protein [Candidatus Cloacimonadota bacterium]
MIFNTGLLLLILALVVVTLPLKPGLRAMALVVSGMLTVLWLNPVVASILLAATLLVLSRCDRLNQASMPFLVMLFTVLVVSNSSREPELFFGVVSWFLLPFSLLRHMHVYFSILQGNAKADMHTILSYLWHPVLLIGTSEKFSDYEMGFKTGDIQWKVFIRHLILAYGLGYGAEFLRVYFTETVFINSGWREESLSTLIQGVLLVGPAFFLGMYSIFHFSRACLALYGCHFPEPLIGRVYWPKSPIHFWLSWNIPAIRVLRECFFLPGLLILGRLGPLQFIVLLTIWWFVQALWHGSFAWAMLHAGVILMQIHWARCRTESSVLHRYHKRFRGMYPILTLLYILLSAAIWPGERPEVLGEVIFRIFSSVHSIFL